MPVRFGWILLSVTLLPLLFAKGCICETSGVNRGDVNVISLDDEWQIGEQLAAEIEQQATVVEDPVVQQYVEEMGQEIAAVSELNDREWSFNVLKDESVNAFNIPGGRVYINTGLIAAAETPSQLAGVVAHEVAHGVARHSTERMTKAYGINLVARLVTGGEVNIIEQIAAQLIGSGAMAKFSRDDEREADDLGLEYMVEAGYRPEGMASMFQTMLALRERRPNAVEQFFATHPLTEERISTMAERAETMPSPDGGTGDVSALNRVQERISGRP